MQKTEWQEFILENYPPAANWQEMDELYSTVELFGFIQENFGDDHVLLASLTQFLVQEGYLNKNMDRVSRWLIKKRDTSSSH